MSYKQFTKDVGLMGITNLLMSLSGIILLPILTKTLGVHDYGVWAIVGVTISLVTPFATLKLTDSMVRYLAGEKKKEEIQEGFFSIFFVVLFNGLIVAFILYVLSDYFVLTFSNDLSVSLLFKLASFIVFIYALNLTVLCFFQTYRQINKYCTLTILQSFGELGLIAYFVLSGFGLLGVLISLLISRTTFLFISLFIVIFQIGFRIPKFSKLKAYLSFGVPLIPYGIFSWIMNSGDRYVIGYFMDPTSIGIYSVAYTLGNIIFMFAVPIGFNLYPTISKLWEEGKTDDVKIYLKYSVKYFLMLAIPSVLGLYILSKPILTSLTTPEFVTSSSSIIILLVAVGTMFYGVYSSFVYIIMLAKKTKIIGLLVGISAIINMSFNIIFVPTIGIAGAAIATLVAFCALTIVTVFISFKYLRFEIDWTSIGKSVASAGLMCLILWWINPVGIVNILGSVGIGCFIYFGAFILLGGIKMSEIRSLFK
jgi:O-antigen/teichoic acid export membrane protein